MDEEVLLRYAKIARVVDNKVKSATDMDFITLRHLHALGTLINEAKSVDVSQVTQADIDAMRIIQQAPMRDDAVTEPVNENPTAHSPHGDCCNYFKIMKVIDND